MTQNEISQNIGTKPAGTFFTFTVDRPCKVRKSAGNVEVRKVSKLQGMTKVNYANRAPVKNAVAAGLRDEPELPSHIEKSFTEGNVRFWQGKNGEVYLPICLNTQNVAQVQYFLDGRLSDKQTVTPLVLASEVATSPTKETTEDKGQAQFIGVNIKNIKAIN